MTTAITGSCFCKVVQYRITSAIPMAVNCHCSHCKKISGGAFASLAVVREKHLQITAGKDCLATYSLSENIEKHFCRHCGSPIFNRNSRFPGRCMVALGSLDDPEGVVPSINVHCENKLSWVLLNDKMQNFAQDYS